MNIEYLRVKYADLLSHPYLNAQKIARPLLETAEEELEEEDFRKRILGGLEKVASIICEAVSK